MATKHKANLHLWPASIVILAIVSTVVLFFTNQPRVTTDSAGTNGDSVLATVNGEKITQRDAALFSSLPASEILGMLVDFKLLDQAAERDRVVVSDDDLARREHNLLRASKATSLERLASGMNRTPAGLASQVRHAALLEGLASRLVKPMPQNMIHCRGILIKIGGARSRNRREAFSLARSVQERLDSGASVAALARQYSDDVPSKARGGDLGICQDAIPQQLAFGDHKLFLALIAAGQTEQLKTPVEGEDGYWAIKIVSSLKHPGADDAAYEPMRELWRSMWMQRYEPLVMSRLRSKAKIDPPLSQATGAPPISKG